jgi:hypothetical protein
VNDIITRLAKLMAIETENWTPWHSKKYNNLDKHLTSLMCQSENKCKKRNGKGYMASEEINTAGTRLAFWGCLLKYMQSLRNIRNTTLQRKRKRARVPDHGPMTRKEVRIELKMA